MPTSDAQKKANDKWRSKFEEVRGFRVTPEKKQKMLAYIETTGESMNTFLNRAVDEAMERGSK